MIEEWKDIKGFEGKYKVSTLGNVFSVISNRYLKPVMVNGYHRVRLCGVAYFVHRLVAEAFLPNPDNLPQVNHKDENRINNHRDNLEWCTAKYNMNYGNRPSRYSKKVINVTTGDIYESTKDVERTCGYRHSAISECCNGKRKRAYGFEWRYL